MYVDEDRLIRDLKRGVRSAQQWLYERERLPLYRMCLRYAKDVQEAEDFLHDGMLKALQEIGKYRSEGALSGWVRRVVLNQILQELRRRPKLVSDELAPDRYLEPESLLEEELSQISGQEIHRLVCQLPTGYRTVFNLYYMEGLGHKDIAAQLQISEGSSKSQLYKARIHLRKSILKKYPHYQYRTS
ncbi:MAG: sigma-70 family RNA polymerase sigma factor [Bacteroidota bacterium]